MSSASFSLLWLICSFGHMFFKIFNYRITLPKAGGFVNELGVKHEAWKMKQAILILKPKSYPGHPGYLD